MMKVKTTVEPDKIERDEVISCCYTNQSNEVVLNEEKLQGILINLMTQAYETGFKAGLMVGTNGDG